MRTGLRCLLARFEAAVLGLVSALVDIGPDSVRFGPGRAIRTRLFARRLAGLPAGRLEIVLRPTGATGSGQSGQVVLLTRTLGTGGVERVVATLARELPRCGMGVTVVCERGGDTADSLRRDGVFVVQAADIEAASSLIEQLPVGTVAQLHNAPDHLIAACARRGMPLVEVLHTTDVNRDDRGWARETELARDVTATIAVSRTVRDFHLHHLGQQVSPRVCVIPNGVDPSFASTPGTAARRRLAELLGRRLDGAVVLACLARYDMQKNIPGLVATFLAAAELRDDLHLVVAGPVEDWIEVRLADAVRRSHPAGDRVHLLGTSSTHDLLAASDAFVLDSFFEGWPVAATEAAMAGLPLVLSDVGGAHELVDGLRGSVVANPAGAPDRLDLAMIKRARRRFRRQANRGPLAQAMLDVAEDIDMWRARRPELAASARETLGSSTMAQAHACVLNDVALRSASA